jgi:hypothetical protein
MQSLNFRAKKAERKKSSQDSFVLQRAPLLPCLQVVFFPSKKFKNLTHQPFLTPTTYIFGGLLFN